MMLNMDSMAVMMERGRRAAMGSNAVYADTGSVVVDSWGAESVKPGMELKMSRAGMNSLMMAAGDKATVVLAGREASAARGTVQLVSLRLEKKVQERQILQGLAETLSCCSRLGLLKKESFSSFKDPQPTPV